MNYEPIDPDKAKGGLKLKYTALKQSGGGKSTGASAPPKPKATGIRPRRKSYGPF